MCKTVPVRIPYFIPVEKEVRMSLEAHIQEMEAKRQQLKEKIAEMMTHPSVDDIEIARLKREKLHIKDEIARLKKELSASS